MSFNHSLFLFIFVGALACKQNADPEKTAHRLIYNNDGTEILANNWFGNRPLTPDDLNQYIDMVAGSQLTTYMICSGSDFFYYRSKFGRVIGDDLNGKLNCGEDSLTNKIFHRFYDNAMRLEKEGTDIVEASLKRAREKNLEAFITFRMNDLHFADTSNHCTIQYSDYWIAHPEFWTSDTTLPGWHAPNALDFAHPEVREYKLGIIREQLEKYGALLDGYELDFMRFIVYFKKAEAEKNAPLITELVQSVKHLTDSIGKIHHKKILLTARVPAIMSDCYKKGLDVKAWVKEGLLDFLTIGVHWSGDPAINVEGFRNDLGMDIPVYSTIDDGAYRQRETWSHGAYRAMASNALVQGAAGTMLFNYFLTAYNEAGQQLKPVEGTDVCRIIAPELLQELGSLETLRKRNKVYCLSDGATSYEVTVNSPLPLKIHNDGNASVFVGDDVKTDQPEEAILFIRSDNSEHLNVSINGTELEAGDSSLAALYDKLNGLRENQKEWVFKVPVNSLIKGNNDIQFRSSAETTILRIELAVKYGPVETNGYF